MQGRVIVTFVGYDGTGGGKLSTAAYSIDGVDGGVGKEGEEGPSTTAIVALVGSAAGPSPVWDLFLAFISLLLCYAAI